MLNYNREKDLGLIDTECTELCEAINKIPGLETTESCCGHGNEPLSIWFRVNNLRDLFVVCRCIDPRYNDIGDWRCESFCTDLEDDPIRFRLTSGDSVGFRAYIDARKIAYAIEEFMEDKELLKLFNIGGYADSILRDKTIEVKE
jgi:hypothetical protein